jgi:VWFA-related protein
VNDYFNGQQRVRSQPDKGLKKLAEDTGGGYFELQRTADLNETFTRVAEELHSQYVLGFSPETLDGKVHKLDVRVMKPGMTARARKSYLASSSAGSAPPATTTGAGVRPERPR